MRVMTCPRGDASARMFSRSSTASPEIAAGPGPRGAWASAVLTSRDGNEAAKNVFRRSMVDRFTQDVPKSAIALQGSNMAICGLSTQPCRSCLQKRLEDRHRVVEKAYKH